MERNEEWMLLNYGSRGRRGITPKVKIDSEGEWWASYDKGKTWVDLECQGKGEPGERGEDGAPGVVQDVKVNGVSVLDSEAIASIIIEPAKEYSAGTNITISSEGVISATVPDITIGKELTVTLNLGGYEVGDVIAANTKVQDILEKILAHTAPTPPSSNLAWFGVSNAVPTGIEAGFSSEAIATGAASLVHNYTANRQYECVAIPVALGDFQHIYQNDLPFDLRSSWTRISTTKDGTNYYLYYSDKVIDSGSKFEFVW